MLLRGSYPQPQSLNGDGCVLCDWLRGWLFLQGLGVGEIWVWSVVRFSRSANLEPGVTAAPVPELFTPVCLTRTGRSEQCARRRAHAQTRGHKAHTHKTGTYTQARTHARTCTHRHIHTRTQSHVHAQTRVHKYTCTHTQGNKHARTHKGTNTHARTQAPSKRDIDLCGNEQAQQQSWESVDALQPYIFSIANPDEFGIPLLCNENSIVPVNGGALGAET